MTLHEDHRACVVGQLIFCAHACARWADSQRLKEVTTEVDAESGVVLVLAGALGSKTAVSAEARTRILPYVASGMGVSNVPWAESWLDARRAMGLSDSGSPSFPRGVRASARGGILRWGPLKLRTIFVRPSSQWVVTQTRSWDMGATA